MYCLYCFIYDLLSINEVLSIIYCLLMKINLSARRSSFIRVQASTIWLSKEMLKTQRADTRNSKYCQSTLQVSSEDGDGSQIQWEHLEESG